MWRIVKGCAVLVRAITRHGFPPAEARVEAVLHTMMAGGASCERLRACRIHQASGSVYVSLTTMGGIPFCTRMVVAHGEDPWLAKAEARDGQCHCCWHVRLVALPSRSMSTTLSQFDDMGGAPTIRWSMQRDVRLVIAEKDSG